MSEEKDGGSSQSVGSVTVTKVKTRCEKRNQVTRAIQNTDLRLLLTPTALGKDSLKLEFCSIIVSFRS